MCGFAGFIDPRGMLGPDARRQVARAMAAALAPRGPDDEGVWLDGTRPVTLAFRRLAILDLTPAGHQPMVSACGGYVLAYNGEIYNCEDIRAALDAEQQIAWRGHSDSEVLLEALARWGVPATLNRLDGMFAFALWDRARGRLAMARDRFGEKPLVYGWQNGVFLFGSTLHALDAHPAMSAGIAPAAVAAYFTRSYVPAPLTIREGIAKLPPGSWIEIAGDAPAGTMPSPEIYFDPVREAEQAAAESFTGGEAEALETLDACITASVRRRLRADVPLGVFLSGGIDSSTIAAFASGVSPDPIRTFTIAFPGAPDDEAPFARSVAAHLGTDHTELRVTETEALDALGSMAGTYDEPFADPSALPSIVLCRHTRSAATVALSGDGGDEFFGGYGRYTAAARDYARATGRPAWLSSAAGLAASILPPGGLKKAAARNAIRTMQDAYEPHISRWRWGSPARPAWTPPNWAPTSLPPAARFMAADAAAYLPDNLQTKMDRASMAVGLEVRAPLLDPAIARFAWRMPPSLRIHPQQGGKYLLRHLLARKIPPALFERPKQGFYQPLPAWLRADLREWAEDLLSGPALAESGLIDPAPVRVAWREHQRGRNRALDLWTVLMFQHWLRTQAKAPAGAV